MRKRLIENELNFRNIVRERDNWTCQECGSIEYLQAHHLEPHNGNNNNPDNGITLCVYCHADKHPEVPRNLFISNVIKAEKEGCISADKLAAELEVHPRTIVRRAIKLGILKPMQKWMFNRGEADVLRNEEYIPRVRRISGTTKNAARLSVTVDEGLAKVVKKYAKNHYTSISQLFRNFLAELEREFWEEEARRK